MIEMAFSPTFHASPIALVFRNVRNHAKVPKHFTCFACIEATISIEEGTLIVQSQASHVAKQLLDCLFQFIAIVMVACHYLCRRQNVPIPICYGQDIAGLGSLSPLISNVVAPFFAAL